ncbi:DUF3301 domain-containing protein [Dokdonella sp.]|uniref:DUF3301 domain-containing protein n=1 Tax=Dokdonella sp. TaxID=2291710 RepID=UPI002F423D5A
MLGTWSFLLAIVVAVWAWMDILRARELAVAHSRTLCREAGVQLLDQTVSLKRLAIAQRQGLPTVVRRYGFEVSLDGSDRHRCHLDLAGRRLEAWSLPLGEDARSRVVHPVPLRLVQ